MLDKILESPLDRKEVKPVNPEGNQSWIFIGRADAEALTLWPPDTKNWLIGKDFNPRKDWGQEEKGAPEDEKVGWHHRLNGYEFEQALGDSKDKEAWHAAVPGIKRVRQSLATEHQQSIFNIEYLQYWM